MQLIVLFLLLFLYPPYKVTRYCVIPSKIVCAHLCDSFQTNEKEIESRFFCLARQDLGLAFPAAVATTNFMLSFLTSSFKHEPFMLGQ